ncbi:MAG: hypothetical protein BAJALOKI1v1_1250003 [Promethearchaeota archaeon]|nr:MAG: hypothetical protein BAJALOKI1v1_1250003 [Candidatus Lokiarchaeota archaeon]
MLYTESCIEKIKKYVEKALLKHFSDRSKIPTRVRKEIVENNLIEFLSGKAPKKSNQQ